MDITLQIFTAITEIIETKRASKQWPQIALYRELFERFGDVKPDIRKLIIDKRIRFGRTVNDWYFEPI